MKKPSAILFLTVISLHFAACTLYANGLIHSFSSKADHLKGISSNEFMQFEEKDVMEVFTDVINLDFTPANNAFTCHDNSIYHYSLLNHLPNEANSARPLYIATHSLRI